MFDVRHPLMKRRRGDALRDACAILGEPYLVVQKW